MSVVKYNNFNGLIQNICNAHQVLQENVIQSVNQHLTLRNWMFGFYIVEYEQNGNDRAVYGKNLLESIATELKSKNIKGLNKRTLYNCRILYTSYPQILQSVPAKFQISGNDENTILQSVTAKFNNEYELQSELLLSRLSFTHFVELIRIEDPLQRLFYEVEC